MTDPLWEYMSHAADCPMDPDRDPYVGCRCGLTTALAGHDRIVRERERKRTRDGIAKAIAGLHYSEDPVTAAANWELKR